MKRDNAAIIKIRQKYKKMEPYLSETGRRLWAATEAEEYGYGGIVLVCTALGMSKATIHKGLKELKTPPESPPTRIRKEGGGRKKISEKTPEVCKALEKLVEPATRGHPESALRWTSKSMAKLAEELNNQGFTISPKTVSVMLRAQDYSLQANKKTAEGKVHVDRDAQFCYINDTVLKATQEGQPSISVDTKKKELVGNFKNNGQEYAQKKQPVKVNTHDFPSDSDGKAVPYGVYDITQNQGWVSVGMSSDTAEFSVNTIRTWWQKMGKDVYPHAKELVITADCGGSNSYRIRLWKFELQLLSNETGLVIHVRHFPPGTSKWNKIEHKLFSFISMNWRGKPLLSFQTIISLIGNTYTRSGLTVQAVLDEKTYPTGRVIEDEQFASINIKRDDFHPEWNYSIFPQVV